MAKTYKPKRFTDISLLKRLDFPLLIRLLERYQSFFEAQEGFAWAHDPAEFSYDVLAKIMMNLDTAAPMELLETLYYVEQLSDEEYFDDLHQIARKHNIGHEVQTVQDLALLLQLECPEEVQQYHALIHRSDAQKRAKRFESYFSTNDTPKPIRKITKAIRERMETELDAWAKANKRGIGMRVFVTQDEHAVWFMIRHGQPMKRENAVTEEGGNHQVFYRPEKFDIAIYYPDSDELAISVRTKGQRLAYTEAIGRYCFDDADYFQFDACNKYTLQPLIDHREVALAHWGIPGIEKISLREIQIRHEGNENHIETQHADDIFAAFEKKRRQLFYEKNITIVKAKFMILFSDRRKRVVTIEPPNIAFYDRESDHELVHDWLMERGFIIVESFEEKKNVKPSEKILEAA